MDFINDSSFTLSSTDSLNSDSQDQIIGLQYINPYKTTQNNNLFQYVSSILNIPQTKKITPDTINNHKYIHTTSIHKSYVHIFKQSQSKSQKPKLQIQPLSQPKQKPLVKVNSEYPKIINIKRLITGINENLNGILLKLFDNYDDVFEILNKFFKDKKLSSENIRLNEFGIDLENYDITLNSSKEEDELKTQINLLKDSIQNLLANIKKQF
jgi:coenzyme F420-reducing hydrogenase delta subunit